MKNKINIINLFILILLPAIVIFAGCGKHKHSLKEEYTYNETHHWRVCSDCDEQVDYEFHRWNQGEVQVTPTMNSTGSTLYTCLVCDKAKTVITDKLPKNTTTIEGTEDLVKSKIYDGQSIMIEGITTNNNEEGAEITYEWFEGTTKLENAPTNAGQYVLKISVPETETYAKAVYNHNLKIEKKEVSVTWTAPESLVYSATEKMAQAAAVQSGLISGDTVEVEVTGVNNKNVGTATFTASTSNNNYKIGNPIQKYTITPYEIKGARITLEYTGSNFTRVASITEGLLGDDTEFLVEVFSETIYPNSITVNNWINPDDINAYNTEDNYTINASETLIRIVPKQISLPDNVEFEYTGETTFTYGINNGNLGVYEDIQLNMSVASPNVKEGAQIRTITGLEQGKYVKIGNNICYEIVNEGEKTLSLTPGLYKYDPEALDITAEYNGTQHFYFSVNVEDGEKVYLYARTEDKNAGENKTIIKLSTNRLDEWSSNYNGIDYDSYNLGTITVTKKALNLTYDVPYTGNEISSLSNSYLTQTNICDDDFVSLIEPEFVGDSVNGEINVDFKTNQVNRKSKSLKSAVLTGKDKDNYTFDVKNIKVYIKQKLIDDTWTLPISITATNNEEIGAQNTLYFDDGAVAYINYYAIENNGKDPIEIVPGDTFISGKEYYATLKYVNPNYRIVSNDMPIFTINGTAYTPSQTIDSNGYTILIFNEILIRCE